MPWNGGSVGERGIKGTENVKVIDWQ